MQLVENYAAALDEVLRLKPSAAKGRYLRKATFSTTMGPGIPIDPSKTRAPHRGNCRRRRLTPRARPDSASPRKLSTTAPDAESKTRQRITEEAPEEAV